MIVSENNKPSLEEFRQLMRRTDTLLNSEARDKQEYYSKRNSTLLEIDVYDALCRSAIRTPFEDTISLVSGASFPDIVAGNFYASWGPEIHDLWIEDGMVHITTSPAKRIVCFYRDHRAGVRLAQEGLPLTEASFPIDKNDVYFRITVIDEENRCADTNAYFTDEIF